MYLVLYYDSFHWEHEFVPFDSREEAEKYFKKKLFALADRKGIVRENFLPAAETFFLDTYEYDYLDPHEYLELKELKNGESFSIIPL